MGFDGKEPSVLTTSSAYPSLSNNMWILLDWLLLITGTLYYIVKFPRHFVGTVLSFHVQKHITTKDTGPLDLVPEGV